MEILINLIVWIILFALLVYLADFVMSQLSVEPKLRGIVKAIIAVIALIFLLAFIFGGVTLPVVVDFK